MKEQTKAGAVLREYGRDDHVPDEIVKFCDVRSAYRAGWNDARERVMASTQQPPPEQAGSAARHFRAAFRDHERNERHWTNEETRFWCAQYKLLAKEAIAALSAAPAPKES